LFTRYRRAEGEEGRQQIKWVAYAVTLLTTVIIAVGIWPPLDGSIAGLVLFLVGFLSIPVAVGIAILRHRLFDIDLVINRTLVYGILTAASTARSTTRRRRFWASAPGCARRPTSTP
jgi:hypothetical protein